MREFAHSRAVREDMTLVNHKPLPVDASKTRVCRFGCIGEASDGHEDEVIGGHLGCRPELVLGGTKNQAAECMRLDVLFDLRLPLADEVCRHDNESGRSDDDVLG